jgi:hypothetical protein
VPLNMCHGEISYRVKNTRMYIHRLGSMTKMTSVPAHAWFARGARRKIAMQTPHINHRTI